MPQEDRVFYVRRKGDVLKDENGKIHNVPPGWQCLPPGDASLTRKVKSLGPTWTVKEKRGRKEFSHGIWADADQISEAQKAVEKQRQDPAHQKKLDQARQRRAQKEDEFGEDYLKAIIAFLAFDQRYADVAGKLALLVRKHAIPVGSGTVARSSTVTISDKARLAVMAWMRHQCSDYDRISVSRVKGARRELRRQIAIRSEKIFEVYRRGDDVNVKFCPLQSALRRFSEG